MVLEKDTLFPTKERLLSQSSRIDDTPQHPSSYAGFRIPECLSYPPGIEKNISAYPGCLSEA